MMIVAVAASFLMACPTDEPVASGPTAPDRDASTPSGDRALSKLEETLDDPSVSAHDKLRRLERFQAGQPKLSADAARRLKRRTVRLRKEVETIKEEQAARAAAFAKKREAEEAEAKKSAQRRFEALKQHDLRVLLETATFTVLSWGFRETQPVEPVTLSLDGKTREMKGTVHVGLGGLRSGTINTIDRFDLIAEQQSVPNEAWTASQNRELNAYLSPALSGDLFAQQGRLKRAALTTLLGKLNITPETELAGVKAARLYEILRPTVRQYALVYVVLKEPKARRDAMKAFKVALASNTERGMLPFYEDYADKHIVAQLQQNDLGPATGSVHIPTGFWMRRLADGTDGLIWKFALDRARQFDPDLHKAMTDR